MENPVRTAEHLARVAQRRRSLANELSRLFSSATSFVWEIGCGHGHFLTAYAAAHLTELCIGVDICRDRIERGTRKRDRSRLPNLHFIQAEASDFLESLPADMAPSAIYILFPDPWPKRRHAKNRLMQPDFLQAVANRTGQGTRLHFRTDHEPYFIETEAVISLHPAWEITGDPWPFEQETVFQSRAASHRSLTARVRSPSSQEDQTGIRRD